MNFFGFTLFSSIENFCAFVLLFSLFRIHTKYYALQVAFASILLAQVSFTSYSDPHMNGYYPIIQLILMFLFTWIMFRIHVFYALVMVVIGYIAYGVLKSALLISLNFANIISPNEIDLGTRPAYILQVISAGLALLVSWLILRFDWGFAFVPHDENVRVQYKGLNLAILIVSIIAATLICVLFYYYFTDKKSIYRVLNIVMFGISFTGLFYLAVKKDERND